MPIKHWKPPVLDVGSRWVWKNILSNWIDLKKIFGKTIDVLEAGLTTVREDLGSIPTQDDIFSEALFSLLSDNGPQSYSVPNF